MATDDELVMQDHEALMKLLCDETISPSEAAERIVALCTQRVDAARETASTTPQTTPGLEGFLWTLWACVVNHVAERKPELQGRALEVLKCLKTRGKEGCEGWEVWGAQMDWTTLPILGATIRESFNGPAREYDESLPNAGHTRYLSLCRFIMRLWTADVLNLALYGLWMLRPLEDLDLSAPEGPPKETQGVELPVTRTLAIQAAAVCVQTAGARMFACEEVFGPKGDAAWDVKRGAPGRGGRRWGGVDGYDRERWALWRSVFGEIVGKEGMENVSAEAVDAAKTALVSMQADEAEA